MTYPGAEAQLAVTATYSDQSSRNVSDESSGTNYTISNAAVASITPDGLVTALSSGTVIISATNEGALGMIQLRVVLSGDSDNDGIPDDVEIANGLNPNNPIDGLEDFDGDGLTNKEELVDYGTDIRLADTDGDGIEDGEEVVPGEDGFITSPVLADTDGDGIRDALEIATGTDPTDPASFNLAQALSSIEVSPIAFLLTVNTIIAEASQQLTVTGHLLDGSTIDLTSLSRGTNYSSSNLIICNFGAEAGRIYAGGNGNCTVTVTNSGFSDSAIGTVRSFTPTALGFAGIPTSGFANSVDVMGNFAYVASGALGLRVYNLTNKSFPTLAGSRAITGNANDVKIIGNTAYVAAGAGGLVIINVSNPSNPTIIGSVDTPGDAWDVAVQENLAFVADGAAGLQIIDISSPSSPVIVGTLDTPGTAKGVDLSRPERALAVVADGASGVHLISYADPSSPQLLGTAFTSGMNCSDVFVSDNYAFIADRSRSFTSIDIAVPGSPIILANTPQATGGLLLDVTASGRFAFGADVFFVNGVPIIDVGVPETPLPRAILNFANFRDDNGTGIAVDGTYLYLTAARTIAENGVTGDSRLYVGQYLAVEDTSGVPPNVTITSPTNGKSFVEGTTFTITAAASDNVGLAVVHFLVNGQVVFSDTTAPYQFNYTAGGPGQLVLTAVAVDVGNNARESSPVNVTITTDQPPNVQITAPLNGISVVEGTVVRIFASATDDSGVVASVAFQINGSTVFVDTAAPYIYDYAVPFGITSFTIGATATDNRGKVGTAQNVTIYVVPDQPPTVTINSPAPNTSVIEGTTVQVTATAIDDVRVASVAFLVDGVVQFIDNSWPYDFFYRASEGVSGVTLSARVTDSKGQTANSQDVGLNIQPDPKTTASGRILDLNGTPVEGASVFCFEESGETDSSGGFSITGLRTTTGDIACHASLRDPGGSLLTADGEKPPVPGGVTALGDMTIAPEMMMAYPGARIVPVEYTLSTLTVDLNDDGRLDMIAGHGTGVSIYYGYGDGTFAKEKLLDTDYGSVYSLAVADMNGDGRLDIVAGMDYPVDIPFQSYPGVGVFVALGNDDFQRPFFDTSSHSSVQTGDLNGDGNVDAVTAEGSTLYVHLGNGNGTIQDDLRTNINGCSGVWDMQLTDLNADGKPDAAVVCDPHSGSIGGGLFVLLGSGNGTFQNATTVFTGDRRSLEVADFNSDGKPDVATTGGFGGGTLSISIGNGNGTFLPVQNYAISGLGSGITAVADMNQDGKRDLVVQSIGSSAGTYGVGVLPGNGNGTFGPMAKYAVGYVANVTSGDLNSDSFPDIVTVNADSEDIGVLLSNSNGTFPSQSVYGIKDPSRFVSDGDLNSDGKVDVVISNEDTDTISILLGNGNGTFQPFTTVATGDGPIALTIADFNNDQKADVVTTNYFTDDVSVLLGNGNGTFQPDQRLTTGDGPNGIVSGDLNNDGNMDLVVTHYAISQVFAYLGNGNGTFQSPTVYPIPRAGYAPVLSDLNVDGNVDILFVSTDEQVNILLGNGDGTFEPVRLLYVEGSFSAAAGDVNLDGIPDIVTANMWNDTVSVLIGNGDGSFQAPRNYDSGMEPGIVKVVDVNLDGIPDIVNTNYFTYDVSVFQGKGDGTFEPQIRFAAGEGPHGFVFRDLNGDGKPDIVTANVFEVNASVLLHR